MTVLITGKAFPEAFCKGSCGDFGVGTPCVTKTVSGPTFLTQDGKVIVDGPVFFTLVDESMDGKIPGPGLYSVEGKVTWLNPDAGPEDKMLYYVDGHVTPICGLLM
jgi:hypothetical protein